MNKLATIALAAAPFVAVGAGIVAGQFNSQREVVCDGATVRASFMEGRWTAHHGGEEIDLNCGRNTCLVRGPERLLLEVGDGRECLEIGEGQSAGFMRDGRVALVVEERTN